MPLASLLDFWKRDPETAPNLVAWQTLPPRPAQTHPFPEDLPVPVKQTLIAAGLIDEHRLWIVPMILGKGNRLFEPGLPPHRLTLAKTLSTSKGVLINTYRPTAPRKQPKNSG